MNLVLCNLVPLKEKTEGDKILSRLIAELSGYDFFFSVSGFVAGWREGLDVVLQHLSSV